MVSEGSAVVTRKEIIEILRNDNSVFANMALDFFDELRELGLVVVRRSELEKNAKTFGEISNERDNELNKIAAKHYHGNGVVSDREILVATNEAKQYNPKWVRVGLLLAEATQK